MTGPMPRLLQRLDHNDRLLLVRWMLDAEPAPGTRLAWVVVTQMGSAVVTIASALLWALAISPGRTGAWLPGAALALSFLVAQVIKRTVQRDRPSLQAVIACPDRFSFPSGHACASLAVSLSIGLLAPGAAVPLVVLGMLVGWSRVVLGVHYPGDVLAGQVIALATVGALYTGL